MTHRLLSVGLPGAAVNLKTKLGDGVAVVEFGAIGRDGTGELTASSGDKVCLVARVAKFLRVENDALVNEVVADLGLGAVGLVAGGNNPLIVAGVDAEKSVVLNAGRHVAVGRGGGGGDEREKDRADEEEHGCSVV